MSTTTTTIELVKPTDESFRPAPLFSRRQLVRAAVGHPAAIVGYSAPMALLSIVIAIMIVAATPAGHAVYANNVIQFIDQPSSATLALLTPLVLLWLAVHAFGSATAQLIVTSRLLSHPIRLTDAWRQSARLLARTLPIAAILGLVVGVNVAITIVAILIGTPVWIAVPLLIVTLAVSYPVVYLFSIAVLRPLTARGAWREMRDTGRAVSRANLLARIPVALPLVLSIGAAASIRFAESVTPPTLLATTLYGIAITVLGVLAVVGLVAEVSRLTLEGLSRREQPQIIVLPAPATGQRSRGLALSGAAVVAVAVPFTFLAGVVAVNPTNITTTTTAEIGEVAPNVSAVDVGSGVVINRSEEYSQVRLAMCVDGRCQTATRAGWRGYGKAMAAAPGGGVITARWIAHAPVDDHEKWQLEVAHYSASDLEADPDPGHNQDSTVLEPVNPHVIDSVTVPQFQASTWDVERDVDLVIDTSGTFPVIASIASLTDERIVEGVLSVYRCVDAECSGADRQSIAVRTDNESLHVVTLDLALADDGTAFVTVMSYQEGDSRYQDDTALIVAPPDGPVAIVKVIDGPEYDPGRGSQSDADDWAGSQVVLSGEGNPMVLYRLHHSGAFSLLVCEDPLCSRSSTRDVPGLTSADYFPAFTVDASGRPLVATYSANAKSVVVLSCADADCTEFETRVVAAADPNLPTALALSLDRKGLPIITISDSYIYPETGRLGDAARIVLCQQARCGAT